MAMGLSPARSTPCLSFLYQVGYLVLTNTFKFTDQCCIACGGAIMGSAYILVGHATALWQVFALFSFIGAGLGTFMGAFVNLPSIYIAKFYPKGTVPQPHHAVTRTVNPKPNCRHRHRTCLHHEFLLRGDDVWRYGRLNGLRVLW